MNSAAGVQICRHSSDCSFARTACPGMFANDDFYCRWPRSLDFVTSAGWRAVSVSQDLQTQIGAGAADPRQGPSVRGATGAARAACRARSIIISSVAKRVTAVPRGWQRRRRVRWARPVWRHGFDTRPAAPASDPPRGQKPSAPPPASGRRAPREARESCG